LAEAIQPESVVNRLESVAIRLESAAPDIGAMLRALLADPALDTGTLACLAGNWRGGEVLIGWQPRRTTDRLAELADAEDGCWIGCIDYSGDCWFGLFDTLLRRDAAGSWWLSGDPELARTIERLRPVEARSVRLTGITATDRDDHLAAVENAISEIRSGQLYQVNVCGRLSGRIVGEPVELFLRGLDRLAPEYAAFLRTPQRTVVSLSPELFLHRHDRTVRSAPIKGTRLRTGDRPDDPGAVELRRSAKDRAENVMIVDLVRNDLSRVCELGTVKVSDLLGVRPAPGVWHLVSEVTGRLAGGVELPELLAAGFPPGSVTGAPKIRACRLIEELEPVSRGLFTGALGYADSHASEFNVAIRTFEITGDRFELGVGGGITADSVPMAEWQECLIKAAPLLALADAHWPGPAGPEPERADPGEGIFDTLLCREGRLIGLADHLARLEASCLELYGTGLPSGLPERLAAVGRGLTGRHRVRLTVRPGAEPLIEIGPAPAAGGRLALHRAERPPGNWRHKWVDRRWLAQSGSAALFHTAAGCVAETGTANLVLIPAEGVVRTPVLSADVLPGVTRRRFLDAAIDHGWRVELGRVEFAELHTARLVLALSSLRELVLVDRLDGVDLEVDHRLLELVGGWLG
jgi:para-aminobenzoate synthetase/4-amino-4-deoxychorismate lyase